MPDTKPDTEEPALSPALERHLADPAEKTEEVAGEQAAAKDPVPTEPGTDTENQPS